ncbi:MAG: 7-carboxy-7-deazaguanine synthase [Gemmatimonadaceae bacterium]|nr:7-carboxy-7-deazaguanine synthase [Gemmatimonadaceae bacterium]
MSYTVKEIFYTLQGEGANAGKATVFCRFSGCNLWTGREEDRSRAVCNFCDTDFVGVGPDGGRFTTPESLAAAIANAWRGEDMPVARLVVCTGGEPLLQMDEPFIAAVHNAGFTIAIETNGTMHAPRGIDWICVSPKAGASLVQNTGDELKLVFPQPAAMPEEFEALDFDHFFLQPMDGPAVAENTRLAIEYCMRHPRWRLSLQTHKQLGIR